ncbi:hypothetical protein ACTUVJ_002345 [Stenotrophomonas indicatrix]
MAGNPTPDGGRDYLLTMESVVGAIVKGAGFQDTGSSGWINPKAARPMNSSSTTAR